MSPLGCLCYVVDKDIHAGGGGMTYGLKRFAALLLIAAVSAAYIGWLSPIHEVRAAAACATPCQGFPGNFHITPNGKTLVFAGPGGSDVLNSSPQGLHNQSVYGTAGSANGGPGFQVGPPSIGGPGATHGQGGDDAAADACDLAVSLGTDLSDCLQ